MGKISNNQELLEAIRIVESVRDFDEVTFDTEEQLDALDAVMSAAYAYFRLGGRKHEEFVRGQKMAAYGRGYGVGKRDANGESLN